MKACNYALMLICNCFKAGYTMAFKASNKGKAKSRTGADPYIPPFSVRAGEDISLVAISPILKFSLFLV